MLVSCGSFFFPKYEKILGPGVSEQARTTFTKACKMLKARTESYKDQTELVTKLKDGLQNLEDIGYLMEEEITNLKAQLVERKYIGKFGELIQLENAEMKKKLSEVEEYSQSKNVIISKLQRDIKKLKLLFRRGSRAV